MKVQFPHLSRAQKELLITWGEDSEVLVVQQVAANNRGLAILSLRILHTLQLMHARDNGSVCKTSCPPPPSVHTRTHTPTHTQDGMPLCSPSIMLAVKLSQQTAGRKGILWLMVDVDSGTVFPHQHLHMAAASYHQPTLFQYRKQLHKLALSPSSLPMHAWRDFQA